MDKLMLFASEVWREFDGCCDPQNKGRTRPGYKPPYADELKEVGKFHYYKKYSTCAENEIDHVFLLIIEKQPILAVVHDEIAEVQWESIDAIAKELGKNPDWFTAWFPQAFELVVSRLKQDAVHE